jgi:hypothetical protein
VLRLSLQAESAKRGTPFFFVSSRKWIANLPAWTRNEHKSDLIFQRCWDGDAMMWRLWLRLQTLFCRERNVQRLDDEMQFHIDQQIAENRAAGMSPEEARYAAMRTFGNPTVLKEETRDTWGWTWPEQMAQDLRYGARALAKNPGFTMVAVLAVALGIGVNTGIFSVLNGVALKLLPVPRADEIVGVDQRFHGRVRRIVYGEPGLFSYFEYCTAVWRKSAKYCKNSVFMRDFGAFYRGKSCKAW